MTDTTNYVSDTQRIQDAALSVINAARELLEVTDQELIGAIPRDLAAIAKALQEVSHLRTNAYSSALSEALKAGREAM